MTADLREFIETTDLNSENGIDSIRIQARLLWITPETVRYRRFLRLYMGEQHSPEPLEEQQKVPRAQRTATRRPRPQPPSSQHTQSTNARLNPLGRHAAQ
jgi:hypothetical protein